MAAPSHSLHVPLPRALFDELAAEARRSGEPATRLARRAIELWLEARRKLTLHRDIAAYAAAEAGGPADLDEDLEAAAIESLVAGDGGVA